MDDYIKIAEAREADPYCDGCTYLKPTEENQTKDKEHHRCLRYDEIVRHRHYHPHIMKCCECVKNGGKCVQYTGR
jgi:hypothetical protein